MDQLSANPIVPPVSPLPLSPADIARIFNHLGGAQVRWNEEQGEFATVAGDRYLPGDVEDVVRGIVTAGWS